MPYAPGPGATIASVYIAITIPLLLLQLATLPLFIIHKSYRDKTCFRILFTNGITDCLQLATMAIYAIINLCAEEMGQTVQKIGAAIMLQVFCLVVFQHFLLALNRLVVILRARNLGTKFPLTEEMEARLFNAMHVIIWLLYALNVTAFLSPYCGGLFDREKSSFYYDLRLPYTSLYHDIAFYIINILPAICFAIYIWIVWMAKQSRRRIQSGHSAEATLSPYEFNLLLQSIILYTIMTALILEWKLLGGVSIIWQAILIETPYLLFCGLNPFLYLLMNKEFRNRFCALYRIGK